MGFRSRAEVGLSDVEFHHGLPSAPVRCRLGSRTHRRRSVGGLVPAGIGGVLQCPHGSRARGAAYGHLTHGGSEPRERGTL